MKKFLIGLIVVVALVVAGFKIADTVIMGGTDYYVQITTDGTKKTEEDNSGNTFVDYAYKLTGYDQDGNQKTLDFDGNKDRPLRKNAYLKLTWNEKKGVTSYEEVQAKDIPTDAKSKLDK